MALKVWLEIMQQAAAGSGALLLAALKQAQVTMVRRGDDEPASHGIVLFAQADAGLLQALPACCRQARVLAIAAGGQQKYIDGFGPKVDGFDQVAFDDEAALKAAIGPETAALMIEPIQGEALGELVRQFNLANVIMTRLTRVIDRAALTAIMTGVTLDMSTQEASEASARALEENINDIAVKVTVRSDELNEKHALWIERMHHGNVKVSAIDAEFVRGADYAVLAAPRLPSRD